MDASWPPVLIREERHEDRDGVQQVPHRSAGPSGELRSLPEDRGGPGLHLPQGGGQETAPAPLRTHLVEGADGGITERSLGGAAEELEHCGETDTGAGLPGSPGAPTRGRDRAQWQGTHARALRLRPAVSLLVPPPQPRRQPSSPWASGPRTDPWARLQPPSGSHAGAYGAGQRAENCLPCPRESPHACKAAPVSPHFTDTEAKAQRGRATEGTRPAARKWQNQD